VRINLVVMIAHRSLAMFEPVYAAALPPSVRKGFAFPHCR
jgi:hypothetical protein